MNRIPTARAELYAWHTAALAGRKPLTTHDPQCGYFLRRLEKGGPLVPARIFMEQPSDPETGELIGDERMVCEVNGQRRDPEDQWTWLCGMPISQEDFLRLSAASFAGDDRPNHLPF